MTDLSLYSSEKVYYKFALVGLGSRFIAHLIDTFIIACVYAVLAFFAFITLPRLDLTDNVRVWVFVGLIIMSFFLTLLYFLFFETTWNGQTPGKRAAGIRVIRSTGEAVTFGSILVRNIMRILDFLPGSYTVGILTILFNKSQQRVGDMIANTVVVREHKIEAPETFNAGDVDPNLAEGIRPVIYLVSEEDFSLLRDFFARRPKFSNETSVKLAKKIAANLAAKMGMEAGEVTDHLAFLQAVGVVFKEKGAL